MIAPLRWTLWLIGLGALVLGASWLVTMPGKDIRGTWATDGHGLRFDIGRAVIDIYQVTDISCHHARRIPANTWLIHATQDITLARDGDRLRIDAGGTLGPIMADPTEGLPATCPQTPPTPGSARENFDVLWQAMAEHYALFDLHKVDWAARRRSLRPAADTVLTEAALLDLFKATLDGLDDARLTLRTPGGAVYSPAVRPDWFDDRHMVRDATLAQVGDLTPVANTGLLYGWAAPGIGYVYLAHMDTSGGFNVTAQDQARNGFAEIALAFAAADGIILDARYTPGGADDAALTYARYFSDQTRPVLTRTTRTRAGETPPFRVRLEPEGRFHLDQRTVVLTSGFTTGSADPAAGHADGHTNRRGDVGCGSLYPAQRLGTGAVTPAHTRCEWRNIRRWGDCAGCSGCRGCGWCPYRTRQHPGTGNITPDHPLRAGSDPE
ncbi:S41 family peptidase, partial [Yoonia sp.]|uniref:S41 family peptidase n=1 Tax=Yoonia sp. TaxID=2212373 RepID=UPI003F6D0D85